DAVTVPTIHVVPHPDGVDAERVRSTIGLADLVDHAVLGMELIADLEVARHLTPGAHAAGACRAPSVRYHRRGSPCSGRPPDAGGSGTARRASPAILPARPAPAPARFPPDVCSWSRRSRACPSSRPAGRAPKPAGPRRGD